MTEKNRREISKYLFQEGVCCAKKDYDLAKHPDIDVYYYWYLTNDGIEPVNNEELQMEFLCQPCLFLRHLVQLVGDQCKLSSRRSNVIQHSKLD
ncbi:hypothetical protein AgCh_028994 [Apium graveolens]